MVEIGITLNESQMSNIKSQIANLDEKPINLELNTKTIESQIKGIKAQIESLKSLGKSISIGNVNTSGINAMGSGVNKLATEVASATNKMSTSLNEAQQKLVKTFQTNISLGKIDTDILELETRLKKLGVTSESTRKHLEELKTIRANANGVTDTQKLVELQEQYNTTLQKTKNELRQEEAIQKQIANDMKVVSQRNKLGNDMSLWLKQNSAAAKQFGARVKQLQTELKTCDSVRMTGIKNEFKQITQEAQLAGKTGLTMRDSFQAKLSSLGSYVSAITMITYGIQGLQKMYDNVLNINTAMTELRKVTDETNASYNQFLDNAAEKAGQVSATISEYTEATSNFARLGYSMDESSKLAQTAMLYHNVGDEIDSVDQATESLISTMKGFGLEANNSMSIVDKFNYTGKLLPDHTVMYV